MGIYTGVDRDGMQIVGMIDLQFEDVANRGKRQMLVAINFPGPEMVSEGDRGRLCDALVPFCAQFDGVFAAGIAKPALGSYMFLYYVAATTLLSEMVPVPDDLKEACSVWIVRDSDWMEYPSSGKPQLSIVQRLRMWLNARLRPRGIQISREIEPEHFSDPANEDRVVLAELATHGSDLRKPTDIVFFMFVPDAQTARTCADTLWARGLRAHVVRSHENDSGSPVKWGVAAHLDAVPEIATIREVGGWLTQMAKDCGGEYDGWEARIA